MARAIDEAIKTTWVFFIRKVERNRVRLSTPGGPRSVILLPF